MAKFADFDEYQLAKYNKERRQAAKKPASDKGKGGEAAAQRGGRGGRGGRRGGRGRGRGSRGRGGRALSSSTVDESDSESDSDTDSEDDAMPKVDNSLAPRTVSADSDDEETLKQLRFTLKQLIRKLHIVYPAQFVVGILGKKYPKYVVQVALLPAVFTGSNPFTMLSFFLFAFSASLW